MELPKSDVIGGTTVLTWLDESRGMHTYRTEVSQRGARLRADVWSTVAESIERAERNHESGLVQAADVEIEAWVRSGDVGLPSAAILEAARVLRIDAGELADTRLLSREHAHALHRRAAIRRIAEIEAGAP